VIQAADAAREQDEAAYLACFTDRSRAMLAALWEAAGEDRERYFGLGAAELEVREVQSIRPAEAGGPERARVVVAEGDRELAVVVHAYGSRWRIDLFDTERQNASLGFRF
jgi:hypothetical protein